MQLVGRLLGEFTHLVHDEICGQGVLGLGADVVQRCARRVPQDMNVLGWEDDPGEVVVTAQAMEPAVPMQKVEPGAFGACGRSDQMNLVGNPRVGVTAGQGIERFGNDLGREARDGQENALG